MIGGAAVSVHYGVSRATTDIDTYTVVGGDLAAAVRRATDATGLRIPFQKSGPAEGPYEFEDRFERAMPELGKLVVKVPERHDLALMKTLRGDDRDLVAIAELHTLHPLDLEVLVTRYNDEVRGVATGHPMTLRGKFLNLVERLFPDDVRQVEKRLRAE